MFGISPWGFCTDVCLHRVGGLILNWCFYIANSNQYMDIDHHGGLTGCFDRKILSYTEESLPLELWQQLEIGTT